MALALNDLSDLVDQLNRFAAEEHGAGWVAKLVQRLIDESGLDADVVIDVDDGRESWDVAVMVGTLTVALIGVVTDAERPLERIDEVESKATRRWRQVGRLRAVGHVRPWIGCIVLGATNGYSEVDELLRDLINCRTLDAAFQTAAERRSVGAALGIDPFAAALLARLVFVRTVLDVGPAVLRSED